jgi:hypothetical protein
MTAAVFYVAYQRSSVPGHADGARDGFMRKVSFFAKTGLSVVAYSDR